MKTISTFVWYEKRGGNKMGTLVMFGFVIVIAFVGGIYFVCLLYTSDAADE